MRIAQLAPLSEIVPPAQYGGTELVVSLITEELVKRGHEVTLFATGNSQTTAKLVSITSNALRTDDNIPIRRWAAYDLITLLNLEERQQEFDIIHNHMGYHALPFLRNLRTANLTTNHNIVKSYCTPIFLACNKVPYVAISKSYRKLNYPNELNYIATIYNGIDLDKHTYNPDAKREYLLFIGRICHDKGTAIAIDIAESLGMPLIIAGKVDTADKEYWEELVKPRLEPGNVEYLGEVSFNQKVDLYNKAIAVLYPITFNEPFGLVMAESLASGTPVAALDRGSVREIVSDGETGIVAQSKEELIERFQEIDNMSKDKCRERVVELFSKERMVDDYEQVYKQLCNK